MEETLLFFFQKRIMTSIKELEFKYGSGEKEKSVLLQVPIPLSVSVPELGARLLSQNKIPFYVKDDLNKALEEFSRKETTKYYDELDREAVEKIKKASSEEIDELVQKWTTAFKEEHMKYAKVEEPSEKATFPEMYHRLIHSPALETLLNLEHSYALSVGELVQARDQALHEMQQRQSDEMERAVPKVGISLTDQDINNMATRHFTETQNVTDYWDHKISSLKETQKREFHEWVMKVHEDYQSGTGSPGYLQRVRALSEATPMENDSDWTPQPQRMEESFTIHLGSQLKLMHNLRLLSADVLDLCRHKLNKVGGIVVPQPQRLQTAISLYSNNLSGLVLLVDNRINSYTGIKREFAAVCQMSTEFHFEDIDQALEIIREQGVRVAEWRAANSSQGDSSSQSSSGKSNGSPSEYSQTKKNPITLKTGDFYITRHSNLSEVHLVFHLVVDDTLRSADVNSRHPTILGLRNILRVAHEHDVCTVTIPLLLVHEMSEEMTIQWCLKRAELMFKCIKGFMIEMASLVGDETRTVQFLVPKGISEELFSSLSNLLSAIFRVSNPVVLK
ncbi:protein C12orf4 homolog [Trichonephila inaurata madagascariensis]|uniref:Protein C12orf4 homolog n=1 Tax=Trichonephila inaurata madagascariensis TaxID=2747483 RepID=A0A8X6IU29_9ARAC|nr:protein C12orf4 homolog [Trichonephila inaurata madagascariensis]